MIEDRKKIHVLSSVILSLVLISITFSTENPIILLGIFMFLIGIFIFFKAYDKFKKGLLFFIPIAIITILINVIFVSEGKIVLFSFWGHRFTLESIIYAVILSFKLLLMIYIFFIIGIIVDSDKAVSYFSSMMPKSTLTMMIALKLVPSMKLRLQNIKEIYSIRGVDFQKKGIKNKVISYIPILSILLESSLDSAFDIGEAAYIRGFLSGKRTVYDKQKFSIKDWMILIISSVLLVSYIFIAYLGVTSFDVYSEITFSKIVNKGSIGIFILLVCLLISVTTEKVL